MERELEDVDDPAALRPSRLTEEHWARAFKLNQESHGQQEWQKDHQRGQR